MDNHQIANGLIIIRISSVCAKKENYPLEQLPTSVLPTIVYLLQHFQVLVYCLILPFNHKSIFLRKIIEETPQLPALIIPFLFPLTILTFTLTHLLILYCKTLILHHVMYTLIITLHYRASFNIILRNQSHNTETSGAYF